jgi:hypothetical protein
MSIEPMKASFLTCQREDGGYRIRFDRSETCDCKEDNEHVVQPQRTARPLSSTQFTPIAKDDPRGRQYTRPLPPKRSGVIVLGYTLGPVLVKKTWHFLGVGSVGL